MQKRLLIRPILTGFAYAITKRDGKNQGFKHGLVLLLIAGLLFQYSSLRAQTAVNYSFITTASGSLTADRNGNGIDMSTGTTQLVAASNDDQASSVVNLSATGFEFYFMGARYTQFSASSNGLIRLGATTVPSDANTTTPFSVATATAPLISPFTGDLYVSTTGKVHYKLTGTAPNRVLVVEFLNMAILYSTTASVGINTFQARLYESSNIIEFVYGTMNRNTGTSAYNDYVGIGFANGTAAANISSVVAATNTNANVSPFTMQTYAATASGPIANLNSSADGDRRIYTFTPGTPPNAPTIGAVTSITSSGMTLNWTDNSSDEIGFIVLQSTDNSTFTQVGGTLPANTQTYAATGLIANTQYYWKVVALKETGSVSAVTQATTSAPTIFTWKNTVASGLWADATNWVDGVAPSASSDVILFNSTATVTMPSTATIGKLTLSGSGTTVALRGNGAAATLTISGSTGTDLDIPAGTTLVLDQQNTTTGSVILNYTGTGHTADISGTLTLSGDGSATIKNIYTGTNAVTTVAGTVNNRGTVTGTAATVIFSNGSTYNHNFTTGGGTIPTATWGTSSTLSFASYTTNTTVPSGLTGQNFGNIIWNCTGQTATINLSLFSSTITATGTFSLLSHGSGLLRLTTTGSGVLAVANFNQASGTTLDMASSTGTPTLRVSGNFIQAGTASITETSTGSGTIEFNGTSAQAVTIGSAGITNTINIRLSNTGNITLAGTLPINSNATLTVATAASNPISGGTITYASTSSTLAIVTSAGPVTVSSLVFPATNGPASLIINNSSANTASVTNNLVTIPFSRSLTGTLTMTAGSVALSNNTLTLGASAAAPGTLSGTGAYFVSGSFARYIGTAAIASEAIAGRFPFAFVNGTTTSDRTLFFHHAATGTFTSGGLLTIKYTNVSGTTDVTPFADGSVSIDRINNSNWEVTQSGFNFNGKTVTLSTASLTSTFANVNDISTIRLVQTTGAAGSAGTNTGTTTSFKVLRTFTDPTHLSNTFYVGSDSNLNPFSLTITAIATGNWGDASTWDNGVPAASNPVIIPGSFAVTVNGASGSSPVASRITIGTGGSLIANANTLTIGKAGGDNKSLTVNGTLTIAGGNINLNGNLVMSNATFNMSSGNLNIDGNDGTTGGSVASGTDLFAISGTHTSTVTGGTILFVDPPFAGAGRSLSYSNSTTDANWLGNTVKFGDGASAHASTNTSGFLVNNWVSSNRLLLGNVIVDGGNAANRFVSSTYSLVVNGNLTINANSELNLTSILYVGGNLINNGTLTNTTTLYLGRYASSATASPVAQTVSGTGTFKNAATATANIASLTINNNSAGGVTIGVNNLSVAGTLTLTSGLVYLGSNNLTVTGTISGGSATAMFVQNGTGILQKTFASGATSAVTFPVGTINGSTSAAEYTPATLTFSANSVARTIGVKVTNAAHGQMSSNGAQTSYINRYWTFADNQAGNGTYSYTGSFTFVAADLNSGATATNMKVNRWNGSSWIQINSSTSTATVLSVSSALTESTGTLHNNDFTARINPTSDYEWNGVVSTDWADANNWSPPGNPGATDNVTINDANAPNQPIIASNQTIMLNKLTIDAGALTVGANTGLTVSGEFTYNPVAQVNFDNSSTFTYSNTAVQTIFALNYGNLVSTGTAARTLENGTINIYGTFTSGSNAYTAGVSNTVNFIGNGAITIPALTYTNLEISGNRGANNVTWSSGTTTVTGTFTSGASFTTGQFIATAGTVVLNNAGSVTVPAVNYFNLNLTGGDRILPASGTVKVSGTFTPGSGTFTVTGSTLEFGGTATFTIPALTVASGPNYNNLILSSSSASSVFGGNVIIGGNYTQTAGTVAVANSAVTRTINVNGNFNMTGGTFNLIATSTVTGVTVNVAGNVNLSGSSSINLESASSTNGVAVFDLEGNFTSSSSSSSAVNFGSGTVAGNEFRIAGDFTLTAGKPNTSSGSEATGFTFDGISAQNFSYTSASSSQYVQYNVKAGSALIMNSNLALTTGTNPTSRVVVNGTLDLGSYTITATTNPTFTANAGAIVKTSHPNGLNGALTGFATRSFNAGSDLEFYGTSAITNSASPAFPATLRDLIISNTGGVTLAGAVTVDRALIMNNGVLRTGANKISLGANATISETNSSYVLGEVETTRSVNSATTYDFGGIGIQLTPATNSVMPGNTVVRRVTGQQMNGGGPGLSIPRYFDIQPATNTGLDVTMVFHYLDHEVATFIENSLIFYRSADQGTTWVRKPESVVNVATNTLTHTSIDAFSYWTAGSASSPLPVTMVYFKATAKGKDAVLDWQTSLEVDNAGFEVEVSADMEQFRKLGFITGKGSNSTYQFIDTEAGKQSTRYYRLKQIDLDGTVAYSPVRAVEFSKGNLAVEAWPNPFRTKLHVQLTSKAADKMELQLTDALGRVIMTELVPAKVGSQSLELTLPETLPNGVYFLQVQNNLEKTILKVVKN